MRRRTTSPVLAALAATLVVAAPAAAISPAPSAPSAPFADLPAPVLRAPADTVADVAIGGLRSETLVPPAMPRRAGEPRKVLDRVPGYVFAGTPITVTTRATPVRVSVLRVDRRGRALRTVRRTRVAARSSKALRLPGVRGALHELRVSAAGRTRTAYAYTPHGASAQVFLDRRTWRAGEQLAGELLVDGDLPLLGGVCGAIEELRDGAWRPPRSATLQVCSGVGALYGAGRRMRIGQRLLDDLPPGRYRYRWSFEQPLGGAPFGASAEFDVV